MLPAVRRRGPSRVRSSDRLAGAAPRVTINLPVEEGLELMSLQEIDVELPHAVASAAEQNSRLPAVWAVV
jgi:hypothetical protein